MRASGIIYEWAQSLYSHISDDMDAFFAARLAAPRISAAGATTSRPTEPARNKTLRKGRNSGKLIRFMDLPVDVFFEVASPGSRLILSDGNNLGPSLKNTDHLKAGSP